MKDLIQHTGFKPSLAQISSKQAEIGRLLRKIKIKLSDSQFKALDMLLSVWLNFTPANGHLTDEAHYLQVYRLHTSKVQKAIFNLRPSITLSLDIAQANALIEALRDYKLFPSSYELMTINHIIQEIDKQTV
ncbi:MAG: hypothetical protein FD170_3944 [Bacteroidetes bacterium]|nr:MAG: hypothetical protein FD170_3944 [Bacteroidota bacterium]